MSAAGFPDHGGVRVVRLFVVHLKSARERHGRLSRPPSSNMHLLLSTLLTATAVWGRSNLEYRATPQVYDACINANDIALTFVRPYIYLRSISDQFTAAGAKATFFMNGNNFDCIYNPDRISDVKYAYAAGHMIGSHTWSHADLTSGLSTAQIQDAMFRMEEAFSRILGIKPAFMRPPFGDYNDNIQSIAAGRGQSLALWDWDTGMPMATRRRKTTANTLVPFAIKLFQSKGYNCLGVQPYQAIGVAQQQTSAWTCDGTPDPGDVCGGSIACETGTPVFSSTTGTPTSTSTTPTSTPPTATPTATTYIHPTANAAKCIAAASNADGAVVEIEDCATTTSQQWTVSGATLQIFGNKCLDVTNGATADGTKMQIWTCTSGNTNQMWTLSGNTIQWKGKSSCLDLTGGTQTDGNPIQIWTCTGGPNQAWTRTSTP
ncbi:hypothetical protein FB45DRAFT_919611 [Roridomyces roridus]|uniref:NodB homology domain-containing protein n=1 Tax=Roridomyces roridus TaxID=1738132 RepID=A0AAD7FNH6_9AGAR|nr:hypothetical protein FB45DRAFT_919611 [Roridomyces roridus]